MLESFVCFILLKRFLNTLYNNNINVMFSIDYKKIVARVEEKVYSQSFTLQC